MRNNTVANFNVDNNHACADGMLGLLCLDLGNLFGLLFVDFVGHNDHDNAYNGFFSTRLEC